MISVSRVHIVPAHQNECLLAPLKHMYSLDNAKLRKGLLQMR